MLLQGEAVGYDVFSFIHNSCSAWCCSWPYLRNRRAAVPCGGWEAARHSLPSLAYLQRHLDRTCDGGVPLKSPVLTVNGWSENRAEPGTDINGQWSQWVTETDWLYLICEKAKPAVIGACRWTAVVLIACIKTIYENELECKVQPAPAPVPGLHHDYLLACSLSSPDCTGGFDSFSALSCSLDCTWKLHSWPLPRAVTQLPELIKNPPADPLYCLIFPLIANGTEVHF